MTLLDLVKHIKLTNNAERDTYLTLVNDAMKAFVSYFNAVVDIEIFAESVTTWTPVTEYLFKSKDEARVQKHDLCINYCNTINDIAQALKLELYIDTNNRHIVACFIGDTLNSIYDKGIHRSFDEMVLNYSKASQLLPDIKIGDL